MSLKFVEVLIIVCAGALFVWWQLRDLRLARDKTRKEREAAEAEASQLTDKASEAPEPGSGHGP